MRILILGSSGFIGKAVFNSLSQTHDVYGASKNIVESKNKFRINLSDVSNISSVLRIIEPEVIINCAGIVENTELAKLNPIFTRNLLDAISGIDLPIKKLLISGSAAEYGLVEEFNIPVDEETPLNPVSAYGQSKVEETRIALELGSERGVSIVIARIFNPIGVGMHAKFIIPGIIRQVDDVLTGKKDFIEVSRLDSRRDYVDVLDIGSAVKTLVENDPKREIYNIGSGISTSNEELINIIIRNSKIAIKPRIIETAEEKEPLLAIQADISRIKEEFGWRPEHIIKETIKEVIHDAR